MEFSDHLVSIYISVFFGLTYYPVLEAYQFYDEKNSKQNKNRPSK